jgi:hypothetical protein
MAVGLYEEAAMPSRDSQVFTMGEDRGSSTQRGRELDC